MARASRRSSSDRQTHTRPVSRPASQGWTAFMVSGSALRQLSFRLLHGIECSRGKRGAQRPLQSMIAGLRLFSKQHLRRAGCWLWLSTSGIQSEQKVRDAPRVEFH